MAGIFVCYRLFIGMDNLLIERVCRQVLNEYMGISDDVQECALEAFDLVMSCFNNTPSWINVNIKGNKLNVKSKVYTHELSNMKLGGILSELNIILFAYNPKEYSYEEYVDYLLSISTDDIRFYRMGFVPSKSKIAVVIPFPFDGKLDETTKNTLISSLYHETEHALQSSRRKVGTTLSRAYIASKKDTDWSGAAETSIPLLKYHVKNCYYALDSDEIDAYLHEIWYEINNGSKLEDSDSYKFMQDAIKGFNWVNTIVYPTNEFDADFYKRERAAFLNVLKSELGLNSANQWFKHCNKGIKKYNDQLRRIIGRFNIETNVQPNGSFKQYANGEIPQGELFRIKRENPSLWRKIVNRFKNMR